MHRKILLLQRILLKVEDEEGKRPNQKNKLTDIAELQGDPGSARGEDFTVSLVQAKGLFSLV